MRESDMAKPVMEWLNSRGLVPYGEVPWYGRSIDVAGVGDDYVETVEMKLSLTNHVIRQANVTLAAADRAWCAVATNPRSLQSRLEKGWIKNVGVLRVIDGKVEVLREAPTSEKTLGNGWRKSIIDACAMLDPFGDAGMPTMRGVGPAQMVFNKVQKFLAEHPSASWREIFRSVPNHYAHYRSMQGAMGMVEAIRNRRARQCEQS